MARHIALLRGINVGAHNRIGMPRLREVLTEAGYENVRTLLASGNVVLGADAPPAKVAEGVHACIAEAFELDIGVVVRSADELDDVIAREPLGDVAERDKRYQVTFLSGKPDADAVRRIETADLGEDRVAFRGREIYSWHPHGQMKSPLAKLLGNARFGVLATARNWNTVEKLMALAREP